MIGKENKVKKNCIAQLITNQIFSDEIEEKKSKKQYAIVMDKNNKKKLKKKLSLLV